MTTFVREVSERVGFVLTDPDARRWIQPERVLWINDGLRALLTRVPSAYVKRVRRLLVPGELQPLPEDCRRLTEVWLSQRSGDTKWRCARKVSRALLATVAPQWVNLTGRGEVRDYAYDEDDPLHFHVYPPQPDGADEQGMAELVYQAIPSWLEFDDPLPVRDDYAMAILNYALHRAYSKDAEFAGNAQIAVSYYQAFEAALTGA